MQCTIRSIPVAVDNALRERARIAGKSLNEAAVDALAENSGSTGSRANGETSLDSVRLSRSILFVRSTHSVFAFGRRRVVTR